MKYRCIECDHDFEVKTGAKPRCPKCMKIHDLEPVEDETSDTKKKSKSSSQLLVPLIVLIIAVISGYAVFKKNADDNADDANQSEEEISSLIKETGAVKGEIASPFAQSKQIKQFASDAANGKKGNDALKSIFDSLAKMKTDGLWKPHNQSAVMSPIGILPLSGAGFQTPFTADELLTRLKDGSGKPYHATSYELSCLLLAAAQSLDLDVTMVEIINFEGVKAPADPGGRFGLYGIKLGDSLFEPHGGRSSAKANMQILNDGESTAPFYQLKALALLAKGDTKSALKMNDAAIKLSPKSPLPYSTRGLIFIFSGGPPTNAVNEFEKALKIRDDAATRLNYAELMPSPTRIEQEVQAVLSKSPDYARAHTLISNIYILRRDLEQAEAELKIAHRLEPNSPLNAIFWSQLFGAQSQSEEAIEKAQLAVKLSDQSLGAMFNLAAIYQGTADFDEMRSTLDKLLPQLAMPETKEFIKKAFNYTPAEEEEDDYEEEETGGDTETNEDDTSEFKLKLDNDGRSGLGGSNIRLMGNDDKSQSGKFNLKLNQ